MAESENASAPSGRQTLVAKVIAIVTAAVALITAIDLLYEKLTESPVIKKIEEVVAGRPDPKKAVFSLEVAGKLYANNPDGVTIKAAVTAAAVVKEERARFVILSRSKRDFMQAATTKGGWLLEFRAPQMEAKDAKPLLFTCDHPVPTETPVKALTLYRADEKNWM